MADPLGLVGTLQNERDRIERYLRAQGAGDEAEDLLQELALRLSKEPSGPVAAPLNYIFRAATRLIIDHRRSRTAAASRDRAWAEASDAAVDTGDQSPDAQRLLEGREELESLDAALQRLPARARKVLLMYRVEHIAQREIASALAVSLSTVEADLRLAYVAIGKWRDTLNKAEAL